MGLVEALLASGDDQTAHAPTLLELDNGDLLCAWFAGSFEGNADISIIYSRLSAGTQQWEPPRPLSDDPTRSEQNPSLFAANAQTIWAMYTAQLPRMAGKSNMQYTSVVRRKISVDGGYTWGVHVDLFATQGTFSRQPIQKLQSGRWIYGTWQCSESTDHLANDNTVIYYSDDKGVTWCAFEMPESTGRVHANIIELEKGHLLAFMRSRIADFIYRSESFDNGASWSQPKPTILPNNNFSISAIMLKSGRIALAFNPTNAPQKNTGAAVWPGLRCPVVVALSEDGGLTWPLMRRIEHGEGFIGAENSTNNRQYEYPFLMQGQDGAIHLVYAYHNRMGIKYVRMYESDLCGQNREKMGTYNPTEVEYKSERPTFEM